MNAYREPDDEGSLGARIAKAEADIAALQSPARRALWAGWRWLGWALLIGAICTAVGLPIGWCIFRTNAYGTAAHANAEREATRWARVYWPTPDGTRIYCEDSETAGHSGERPCQVHFPDRSMWWVYCDDDPPAYNDGCSGAYQATRPSAGAPR